mmetsp:Transcript_10887/g.10792  ORF Transcript_10887/g.10792 Transcript_10887/m.10792 type:complete len:147 (-) Transcript_10887:1558-1998(-)
MNHEMTSVKHSALSGLVHYEINMQKAANGLDRMILAGQLDTVNSYLLYSSYDTLQYSGDFIQYSTTLYTKLGPSDTTYQIETGPPRTLDSYGPTLNLETAITSLDFARDFTPGIVFSRKIYYNFDTEMFTLTENTKGEIKLNLTRG